MHFDLQPKVKGLKAWSMNTPPTSIMDERATTGQKRRRWATVEAPITEELEVPLRRQRIEDRTCLPAEPVATWSTEKVVDFLKERGITEESVLQSFHG